MSSFDQSTDNHWENQHALPKAGRSLSPLRGVGAIFAGLVSVVFLSLATDQVLHVLEVYPPWGEPMRATGLNLLALFYRSLYNVVGGYVTAQIARHAPMRHANILGMIGTLLGLAGAIATIPLNLGPSWYPIALVITALPGCWLGGFFYERRTR
jgi:hypothetical protein